MYRRKDESTEECIGRFLSKYSKNTAKMWRTVVIDECHFLKNLVSYWGIAASLLGLHAERIVPITGTPYNNGSQDIATIMTFIDPALPSASNSWWQKATQVTAAESVAQAVGDWHEQYMIRREKTVLGNLLPPKHIASVPVAPYPMELQVYEMHESRFLLTLDKFSRLANDRRPEAMAKKKKLFQFMLSSASCMRVALIHPVLPGGGRGWTIHFSPSRRKLAASKSEPQLCVCCKRRIKSKNNNKGTVSQARRNLLEIINDQDLGESDDEEDEYDSDDDEGMNFGKRGRENKIRKVYGTGEIVAIPPDLCLTPKDSGFRHYACQSCLEDVQVQGIGCPLCLDLQMRAQLGSGEKFLQEKKLEAETKGKTIKIDPDAASKLEIDRPVYCQDILGGFKPSAKLVSIVLELKSIPLGDKAIILSFFKGSLDLLEAILHYELHINCARFDGDVQPGERAEELERFKTDETCRFLLMSVQTGGVGLNVVEANRVIFIDRWFNPFVHEQVS